MATDRPQTGSVEERTFDVSVEAKKIRGKIPYGIESRDMGGWREIIEPSALRQAKLDDLVATIDHAGVPIGRYPTTLDLEDRGDGMHWSVTPPESRQDVREAVERGDLRGGSWRMVVGRDEWRGDVRHVHEISELRDVSVVTTGAYPAEAAPVELRSRPDQDNNTKEAKMAEKETEERSDQQRSDEKQEEKVEEKTEEPEEIREQQTGGLQVEDRKAETEEESFEVRISEELRSVKVGEVRSLVSADSALSPTEWSSQYFDKLRASSIALQSGIRVITTDSETVNLPHGTADTAPAFTAEGGTIVAGDPGFESVAVTPAKIAHVVQMSNELIDDSEPAAVSIVSDNLNATLALKLDDSVFKANETTFKGMTNVTGVQTGGTILAGGTAVQGYDPVLTAVGLLKAANAPEPYVLAAPPTVRSAYSKLKTSTWEQVPRPQEFPAEYYSTQITTSSFVYSPAECYIVRRTDVQIELDRSRLFNQDMSELRGKLRASFVCPNPTAIVKLTTGS